MAGLREASREQCEVVQRYLDLRERRLLHEGAHARQQLDATMLQARPEGVVGGVVAALCPGAVEREGTIVAVV